MVHTPATDRSYCPSPAAFPALVPWMPVMLQALPWLLALPSKTQQKLSPSLEEAEGRKQPPVDSAGGRGGKKTHKQTPKPNNFQLSPLHATPTGTSRHRSACVSLSRVTISSGHRLHLCVCLGNNEPTGCDESPPHPICS